MIFVQFEKQYSGVHIKTLFSEEILLYLCINKILRLIFTSKIRGHSLH